MRIIGLDILRGFAIILVIFRHGSLEKNIVTTFGWLGVDLFFVISGVLVSGLIFKEYKKSGRVDVGKFLIRRGFKIYPSFYVFMMFGVVFHWYQTNVFYDFRNILSEIFYFQNYLPGIWLHTWSLAVEEHFYIILAIFTFIVLKTKVVAQKKHTILLLSALLVISFILRLYVSSQHRNEEFFSFTQPILDTTDL